MESTSPKTEIGELLKQLEAAIEDTGKVEILIKLFEKLMYSNPEKAMKYAEDGLKLSTAIDFKIGIAKCLNLIGIIHDIQDDCIKALEYYHRSLAISEGLSDMNGIAKCLMNIGLIYSKKHDCQKALDYYHKSLKIAKNLNFKKGIANCLNNIGNAYRDGDFHAKALDYYYKSLGKFEELDDKNGINDCLNNIGVVCTSQRDHTKALKYYHKSLKIAEELGIKRGISLCLNNIGSTYSDLGNHLKALEFFNRSLAIFEELGNRNGIIACLNNIGIVYSTQENHPKALEFYHKSMEIAKESDNRRGIALAYESIGVLYLETGKMQEALNYLNKSLSLSKEIGALVLEKRVYKNLSVIHERLDDPAKALEYNKLYIETNEKYFGIEQTRKIAQLDSRFALREKEREILIWKQASVTDLLTNLLNRQGLQEKMKDEINRLSRNKKPFVISIADIDDFKRFNDKYGHDCGDSVLKAFANILKTSIRSQDHVGRWGGEEFLIILPETNLTGGLTVIEKIRKNIEDHSHKYKGRNYQITSSFGISEYRGEKDIHMVIKEADEALYVAKKRGKNCCVTADSLR